MTTGKFLSILLVLGLLLGAILAIPTAAATAADTHYLVLGDAGCTVTAIASDADCWSHASGGAGGDGVPGPGNAVIVDASSGATTGTQNADMSILSFTVTTNNVIWRLGGFDLTVSGDIDMSGQGVANTLNWNVAGSVVTTSGNFLCGIGGVAASVSNSQAVLLPADFSFGLSVDCSKSNTGIDWTVAGNPLLSSYQFGPASGLFFGKTITITGSLAILGAADGMFSNEDISVLSGGQLTIAGGNTVAVNTGFVVDSSSTFEMTTLMIQNFAMTTTNGLTLNDFFVYTPSASMAAALQWSQTTGDPNTVTYTVGGLLASNVYDLTRNGISVATSNSDGGGTWTDTVVDGWGAGDIMELDNQGPPGGGDFCTVNPSDPSCQPPPPPPPLPLPPECTGLAVTLRDPRPEAANAILWFWDWGDGRSDATSVPTITHTYANPDLYTVTLRVQDKSGRIDIFASSIDLTQPGCGIYTAALVVGPYLLTTLIIIALALLVQMLTGRRTRLTRPLLIALVAGTAVIAVFVYFGWQPQLPGGFRFT